MADGGRSSRPLHGQYGYTVMGLLPCKRLESEYCQTGSMQRRLETAKICPLVFLLAFIVFGYEDPLAEGKEEKPVDDVRPLWEVGVGAFAGWLPDYPAAGHNTIRTIALPYLVYRGDFLRVGGEENRGAVSGRFLKNDRFEFDVTLSAAFPVDSSDNNARRGMPDLDFLFGIGPQLIFKLVNEPGHRKLDFNLQARAVYSTDFSSISGRGYVFNPKLSYTHEHVTDLDLKVFTSAGPVFATEKLMDYFYEVTPEFVTPVRPAYDADAGYLGSEITLGVSKRFNSRFRALIGTRLGIHYGATNRDSPLFKDELNVGVFSAFAWSFAQSERPAR
jgi:outer membrane scaffolding protein for murein synthesis (MipA/OmpV family)